MGHLDAATLSLASYVLMVPDSLDLMLLSLDFIQILGAIKTVDYLQNLPCLATREASCLPITTDHGTNIFV